MSTFIRRLQEEDLKEGRITVKFIKVDSNESRHPDYDTLVSLRQLREQGFEVEEHEDDWGKGKGEGTIWISLYIKKRFEE